MRLPSNGTTRIAISGFLIVAALATGIGLYERAPRPASPPDALAAPQKPPPPPWTQDQLAALQTAIDGAATEGLHPQDYRGAGLGTAPSTGDAAATDALATKAALRLASDYAAGRIKHRHRFNWYIDYQGPSAADLETMLIAARQQGRLGDWLNGLLPRSDAYRALRTALAATAPEDQTRRDRIRVNMERWRWLPRDFGSAGQLYVNLPSYRLEVHEAGRTTAGYRVVIGATDMPTPVLSAPVRQVIANPGWIVPPSIVARSHLRPGPRYSFTTLPNGTVRVRQKPGPQNALGKVKIEFPNALAIYFHDTPAKSLFERDVRAFSHGCVRVQHVDQLATLLLHDDPRLATALAGDTTRSFTPRERWQADIVYLTMVPGSSGDIADLGDPYGVDPAMAAALDGRRFKVPDRKPPSGP